MTTAILDTNVFLQALIGSAHGASVQTLRALDEERFQLVLSEETLDELLDVLMIPRLRQLHGLSDDAILRFVQSFQPNALLYMVPERPPIGRPHDITDQTFLTLAEISSADFLVTNDHRHLLSLRRHAQTRIVTPSRFLAELK